MSFEKIIRIPHERVGVLIGKSGRTKSIIEKSCYVKLDIDSASGEIMICANGDPADIQPFKAMEIVTAIGRGFSPDRAMKLLEEENSLHVIDLREYVGKSQSQIERIKGRIIGEGGKARKNMEQLSGTLISVYGRTVSIIGKTSKLKIAVDAISSLSTGRTHGSVYNQLEQARKHEKLERLRLWEDQNVF